MMKMVIFNLVLQTEDCLFSGCFLIFAQMPIVSHAVFQHSNMRD